MKEIMVLMGTLKGHTETVTAIAAPHDNSDTLVSSSRDKTLIVWSLTKEDAGYYGTPLCRLTGHSHFVQDVAVSSDGKFSLSASCYTELRLWDLNTGATILSFIGHTSGVLYVALSDDNRQIVSATRDHTIKLWNTLGRCMYTIQDADGHSNWISSVRFIPKCSDPPTIISGSWDNTVKVWDLTDCSLRHTMCGHTHYVSTVAMSPDGTMCASGGRDGMVLIWDLDEGMSIFSLDTKWIIYMLSFCPTRYWLGVATHDCIKIWDMDHINKFV